MTTAATLLALAKDARYIDHISTLLQKVVPRLDTRTSLTGGALLYWLSVGRRTLGMEAVGLEYHSQRRRVGLLALSLLLTVQISLLQKKSEDDPEQLRGEDRRRVFERQRNGLAAGNTAAITTQSRTNDERQILQKTEWIDYFTTIAQNLLVWDVEGPHSLPQNAIDASQDGGEMYTRTVLWTRLFMKIILGWYCYKGEGYPTIFHRILRLEQENKSEAGNNLVQSTDTKLVHAPDTKLIGLLILLHSGGTALYAITRRLAIKYVKLFSPTTNGIQFESQPKVDQTQTSRLCGICQQPRLHPACSIKCGHVVCWTCLQSWLLEHPTCPICRVPCEATDVMALHNYYASNR